jgi:hypothetical protein
VKFLKYSLVKWLKLPRLQFISFELSQGLIKVVADLAEFLLTVVVSSLSFEMWALQVDRVA